MTVFCPSCMEELPEKTAKCPFCSYRLTTDATPTIRPGAQIHSWTWFVFLCAGVAISGFLYLFFTQEEPRLSETTYLNYLTENLTITGQEYENLDVLFGQIIEDPSLRRQKDWQARVAFTQKRITETAAKIGGVPPKLVPLKLTNLDTGFKVLAAATKLNADLGVACEVKAEGSACQQITSSTELLQTAFTYLQQESAQLKVLMTLPRLATF